MEDQSQASHPEAWDGLLISGACRDRADAFRQTAAFVPASAAVVAAPSAPTAVVCSPLAVPAAESFPAQAAPAWRADVTILAALAAFASHFPFAARDRAPGVRYRNAALAEPEAAERARCCSQRLPGNAELATQGE